MGWREIWETAHGLEAFSQKITPECSPKNATFEPFFCHLENGQHGFLGVAAPVSCEKCKILGVDLCFFPAYGVIQSPSKRLVPGTPSKM